MDIDKQYQWTRKSKTFKTKYFAALGELFGKESKDAHKEEIKHMPDGRPRANETSNLA